MLGEPQLTWKSLACFEADSTLPTQESILASRVSNLESRSSDSLMILGLAELPFTAAACKGVTSDERTASNFGLSSLSCDWADCKSYQS